MVRERALKCCIGQWFIVRVMAIWQPEVDFNSTRSPITPSQTSYSCGGTYIDHCSRVSSFGTLKVLEPQTEWWTRIHNLNSDPSCKTPNFTDLELEVTVWYWHGSGTITGPKILRSNLNITRSGWMFLGLTINWEPVQSVMVPKELDLELLCKSGNLIPTRLKLMLCEEMNQNQDLVIILYS